MKKHSNGWYIFLYGIFFLLLIPLVSGGIVQFFAFCLGKGLVGFQALLIVGLISSAITFFLIGKNIYGVNSPFVCSFWLDPLFGKNTEHAHERLIQTFPGLVVKPFWWILDSTTRHDREVNIKGIEGAFETFGEDNLNLPLKNANVTLRLPMKHAAKLRSIAKGMDKIEAEMIEQLKPAIIQAIATVFARHRPNSKADGSSLSILENQSEIAKEAREEFENSIGLLENFGAEVYLFSLGDVGFSQQFNDAREETAMAKLDAEAAQAWREKSKVTDAKGVIHYTLSLEDASKLVMMGKKGIQGRINLFGGIPESAGAVGGSFLASMAMQGQNIEESHKENAKKDKK